jgi:AraC-like DNA-binding protein
VRTIQVARPRAELAEFVEAYAQREMDCADGVFSQPNTSTLEQCLAFYLDGETTLDFADGRSRLAPSVTVFGSLIYPCGGARFAGHVLGFAVFLKPLALWQLFHVPASVMANHAFDGEELLGRGVLDLWSKLAESESFEQRIHVVEKYLMLFAIEAHGRTLIMKAAQHTLDRRGAVRINELAHHAALSVRQYERRFVEEVGVAPKLFARTTRFQKAFDAKRLSPRRSWLSIAHALGYFDQMHMVRDFQLLGGNAPNGVLEQSGDIHPWSLAPHQELELR